MKILDEDNSQFTADLDSIHSWIHVSVVYQTKGDMFSNRSVSSVWIMEWTLNFGGMGLIELITN